MFSKSSVTKNSNCCLLLNFELIHTCRVGTGVNTKRMHYMRMNHSKIYHLFVFISTKFSIWFIQNRDLDIFVHRCIICSSNERYS
jgi:hypothetical protein